MKEYFLAFLIFFFCNPCLGDELKGTIYGPDGVYFYYEEEDNDPMEYLRPYIEGQRQRYYNQLLELERQKLLIQQGYRAYGCKINRRAMPDKNITVWIRDDGYYITEQKYMHHPTVENLVNTIVARKTKRVYDNSVSDDRNFDNKASDNVFIFFEDDLKTRNDITESFKFGRELEDDLKTRNNTIELFKFGRELELKRKAREEKIQENQKNN